MPANLRALLPPDLWDQLNASLNDTSAPVPRRPLGRTGERLSVIGFGGIVVVRCAQEEANSRVAEAFERGVNYFDVAPQYGAGEAEERMGPALKPYRDRCFLACKTGKRDKAGAAEELRRSLRRLQTDHVDLYQLHAIRLPHEDVEVALGAGGAIEAVLEAREQGLTRYIGFSSHSVEAALLAMESGLFDTILHPVNFVCHYNESFDVDPMAEAERRGMGRLALKAMALTRWPEELPDGERPQPKCWYQPIADPALAALALRFTLGRGVTAALPPGDENLFRVALNVASKDRPLAQEEEAALKAIAAEQQAIFPVA